MIQIIKKNCLRQFFFNYSENIHCAIERVSGRDSTESTELVPTISEEYPESSPYLTPQDVRSPITAAVCDEGIPPVPKKNSPQ